MQDLTNINREQWLENANAEMNALVFKPAGHPMDLDKIKVTCGYPDRNARPSKKQIVGVCHASEHSAIGVSEICITMLYGYESDTPEDMRDASLKVLSVLAHENGHAIDDCKSGHKGPFVTIQNAIGMVGKPTCNSAGPELLETLNTICDKIGEYPHAKITLAPRKKQTTRNLKLICNSGLLCDDASECRPIRLSKAAANNINFETAQCMQCGTAGHLELTE